MLEECLKPCLIDRKDQGLATIFQQDNASCHMTKVTKPWFAAQNLEILSWPSRSPDLNPIENIWAQIDRQLAKDPPKNIVDLEAELNRHWYDFPREKCIKLIESMPDRVNSCIKARGGHIAY